MTARYLGVMSTVEKDPAKGLNAALAATLKGELAASGMTFDKLAEETGISKRTLLRKLSTMERTLDIDEAAAIAAVFGLTLGKAMIAAEERMTRPRRGEPHAPSA